jgi:hypothetical protein
VSFDFDSKDKSSKNDGAVGAAIFVALFTIITVGLSKLDKQLTKKASWDEKLWAVVSNPALWVIGAALVSLAGAGILLYWEPVMMATILMVGGVIVALTALTAAWIMGGEGRKDAQMKRFEARLKRKKKEVEEDEAKLKRRKKRQLRVV